MTNMKQIKPIETEYKGYRFRSRLEARWAVFFETLGVEWEYEPEGFQLPSGTCYLPDFRVKCYGTRGAYSDTYFHLYIEVKGVMTNADASKIREFCGLDIWESHCSFIGCIDCEPDEYDCPKGFHHALDQFVRPVLCVGNIPDCDSVDDLIDGTCFHSYTRMDGMDIYPFNYETIDGDHFGAYPSVTDDGRFFLMSSNEIYGNLENVVKAYKTAKKARFEHGEKGGITWHFQ